MPLQGKTDEQVQQLQEALLRNLQVVGGRSGNISLKRALGWDEDLYWAVRDRLVDAGVLRRHRARGGAVALVVEEGEAPPSSAETPPAADDAIPSERELYAPVSRVLEGDWARDNRLGRFLVQITAAQGRRRTGGSWTRPDIVVAALRMFPFLPGKFLDLITFEIKPAWAIDVTAVYEALAHRRAATQAFVWLHCPNEQLDSQQYNLDRIQEEAERHGIGMIVGAIPGDYSTWELRVDATRSEPDPQYLNEFLALQLDALSKEQVMEWVR